MLVFATVLPLTDPATVKFPFSSTLNNSTPGLIPARPVFLNTLNDELVLELALSNKISNPPLDLI